MSREEEIITLQQFLRFGETKSIVELMAIQEKEGQAVTVPSSKTDSDIRTFIESSSRTRSPGLLTQLENSNPSSIHHFENIPNSLAFLLPFQYVNPVAAPMLGLPPNGLMLEPSSLRLREPNLPNQSEPNESSESEVSLSPYPSSQSPNRGGLSNVIEPKTEPNSTSPISPSPSAQQLQSSAHQQQQNHPPQVPSQKQLQPAGLSDHSSEQFVKSEQPKSFSGSSFSSKMHRMRRMGSTSRKGRVCCNACGKTFYDKGTLKIHYNAVHLKIKHRCTIEGCNMVFSSLRSRNRHSANPNPRLHMPMLRNNRDKDLIRSNLGSATPVISSTKSGLNLTSPGRPPLGFATPPLDPMLQSPLQSPLVFPSLKSVHPVQPVPPFYRTLLSPGDLVSPPVSLPTSPISLTATNSMSLMEQQQQVSATGSHNLLVSEAGRQDPSIDPMPKKKPRKSSMPVKIEKEHINDADEYDDKNEDEEEGRLLNGLSRNYHQQQSHLHNSSSYNNGNHSGGSCHQSPSQDEMSPSLALRSILQQEHEDSRTRCSGELLCMDSFTSEDQDHERDFENDSDASESKMCCGDEVMDTEDHRNANGLDKEQENGDDCHLSPSPHQPVLKIKEELSDPAYDMFCMSQYGLYKGSGGMAAAAAAAAAAASMAALHESFVSSMGYGSSPAKFSSRSSDGDLCSSPDPKICYVCKKSFKSSYSVKLHYKNVHLKEMHVCTVGGCNAAFPSRRSRDRHSANINLHRKLLTKELDDMVLGPQHTLLPRDLREEFLAKIYGGRHLGLEAMERAGGMMVMRGLGRNDASSPFGAEYPQHDAYCRVPPHDYVVLDLSGSSSIQSSGSLPSSRESDQGSDEGILLDDVEGASEDEEGMPRHSSTSPGLLSGSGVTHGGVVCSICHKMYSNKGTLRVHYKTVHLREMHKCRVPGCNVMFSSVRSRNRHSQNPNLHRNAPFAAEVD